MHWNPFITCAVTGAGASQGVHPELPITPEQIANSAIDAAKAGAAIVHCHVREPETGVPSRRVDLYRDVVSRIREADVDVIVNLTTGMGGDLLVGPNGTDTPLPGSDLIGPDERIAHLHHGRITVASRLGAGTTLSVDLPVDPTAVAAAL